MVPGYLPRVFRVEEVVPAGVCVLDADGEVGYMDDTGDCEDCRDSDSTPDGDCGNCSYEVKNGNLGPLVEVRLPDYGAAVATDRAIRGEDGQEPGGGEDEWRLAEWNALPDECLIGPCDNTEIDRRSPVWLRDGSMRKACVEHWEAVHRVLGDQVLREPEGGGDAYRWSPVRAAPVVRGGEPALLSPRTPAVAGLLYIEPVGPLAAVPIYDELFDAMRAAVNLGTPGPRYRGVHTCVCDAQSANYDVQIHGGVWTNTLAPHYLAQHRDEIPPDELQRVADHLGVALPAG